MKAFISGTWAGQLSEDNLSLILMSLHPNVFVRNGSVFFVSDLLFICFLSPSICYCCSHRGSRRGVHLQIFECFVSFCFAQCGVSVRLPVEAATQTFRTWSCDSMCVGVLAICWDPVLLCGGTKFYFHNVVELSSCLVLSVQLAGGTDPLRLQQPHDGLTLTKLSID